MGRKFALAVTLALLVGFAAPPAASATMRRRRESLRSSMLSSLWLVARFARTEA